MLSLTALRIPLDILLKEYFHPKKKSSICKSILEDPPWILNPERSRKVFLFNSSPRSTKKKPL